MIYLSPTPPPSSIRALHPKSLHVADGDDLGGVVAVVGNDSLNGTVFERAPCFERGFDLGLRESSHEDGAGSIYFFTRICPGREKCSKFHFQRDNFEIIIDQRFLSGSSGINNMISNPTLPKPVLRYVNIFFLIFAQAFFEFDMGVWGNFFQSGHQTCKCDCSLYRDRREQFNSIWIFAWIIAEKVIYLICYAFFTEIMTPRKFDNTLILQFNEGLTPRNQPLPSIRFHKGIIGMFTNTDKEIVNSLPFLRRYQFFQIDIFIIYAKGRINRFENHLLGFIDQVVQSISAFFIENAIFCQCMEARIKSHWNDRFKSGKAQFVTVGIISAKTSRLMPGRNLPIMYFTFF